MIIRIGIDTDHSYRDIAAALVALQKLLPGSKVEVDRFGMGAILQEVLDGELEVPAQPLYR